jgi:hypothetical protein
MVADQQLICLKPPRPHIRQSELVTHEVSRDSRRKFQPRVRSARRSTCPGPAPASTTALWRFRGAGAEPSTQATHKALARPTSPAQPNSPGRRLSACLVCTSTSGARAAAAPRRCLRRGCWLTARGHRTGTEAARSPFRVPHFHERAAVRGAAATGARKRGGELCCSVQSPVHTSRPPPTPSPAPGAISNGSVRRAEHSAAQATAEEQTQTHSHSHSPPVVSA